MAFFPHHHPGFFVRFLIAEIDPFKGVMDIDRTIRTDASFCTDIARSAAEGTIQHLALTPMGVRGTAGTETLVPGLPGIRDLHRTTVIMYDGA